VLAESYFQHAEHYFRILNAMNQAMQQSQQANGMVRRSPMGEGGEGEMVDEAGQPAGLGDQPGEPGREIPIAAAPPED
jgi:hypothetical protein